MASIVRKLVRIALCAVAPALLAAAGAQSFPTRTVTIVNPYPAGGGADIVARALAKELAEEWKQSVIVENRAGAGTTIAAAHVARAPADGYTLLLSTTQHAIAPAVFSSLSYSYLTSFAPIAVLSQSPFILVVRPDSGYGSVADVVAALKQRGTSMNYASTSSGSLPHLAGAYLNQLTGASAVHVPFAGNAPALTALLGGQVDFLFSDTSGLPHIQAGKVRALAVSSAERSPVLPGVPAMQESFRGFEMIVWTGVEAPAGTPQAVLDRIHASVHRALRTPVMARLFAETSREFMFLTSGQFAAFKQAEVQKYQRLARDAGLKAE